MDQNQTVDNDLQKAIDDITNTTNIDPVFSDPVPAESTIPPDDTGKVGDPKGPFPSADLGVPTPLPDPTIPLDASSMPQPNPIAPTMTPGPELSPTDFSAPEYALPTEQSLPVPPAPEPTFQGAPSQDIAQTNIPMPEPIAPDATTAETTTPIDSPEIAGSDLPTLNETPETNINSDTNEIKEAALHDLAPLINKLPLDGTKKFDLCCKIGLEDKTVLTSAYQATHDIPDETERAEALLQIVESIDKM